MILVVGLYGCSYYSPAMLPEGEYAIVRGDKGVTLEKIDGKYVGPVLGGTHKLAPGTHTILFNINFTMGGTWLFGYSSDDCNVELNAESGHEYVVGQRPGSFVISDSLAGVATVERKITAICKHLHL